MQVPDPNQTDKMLWTLLKMGDESAFSLLFDRHHGALFNYGRKLFPTMPDAVEDAIQDLFIDIWRLRGGLTEEINSVRFYLFRSLRRRLHQIVRQKQIFVNATKEIIHNSESSYETVVIQDETVVLQKTRLREALNQLPSRQLEAITLKYFDGFEIAEIAGIMKINEKTVRNFLYKALCALKLNKSTLEVSGGALFL